MTRPTQVRFPDGSVLNFPPGTPPEVIQAEADAFAASRARRPQPTALGAHPTGPAAVTPQATPAAVQPQPPPPTGAARPSTPAQFGDLPGGLVPGRELRKGLVRGTLGTVVPAALEVGSRAGRRLLESAPTVARRAAQAVTAPATSIGNLAASLLGLEGRGTDPLAEAPALERQWQDHAFDTAEVGFQAASKLRERFARHPEFAARINDVRKIESGEDLKDYVLGVAGEQVPIMLSIIGASAAGGPAGMLAAGSVLEGGEVSSSIREDQLEELAQQALLRQWTGKGVTPGWLQSEYRRALRGGDIETLIGAGVAGSLEGLPWYRLVRYSKVAPSLHRAIGLRMRQIPLQMLAEGGTEFLQAYVETAARDWAAKNEDRLRDLKVASGQTLWDAINSAAAGMIIGGVTAPIAADVTVEPQALPPAAEVLKSAEELQRERETASVPQISEERRRQIEELSHIEADLLEGAERETWDRARARLKARWENAPEAVVGTPVHEAWARGRLTDEEAAERLARDHGADHDQALSDLQRVAQESEPSLSPPTPAPVVSPLRVEVLRDAMPWADEIVETRYGALVRAKGRELKVVVVGKIRAEEAGAKAHGLEVADVGADPGQVRIAGATSEINGHHIIRLARTGEARADTAYHEGWHFALHELMDEDERKAELRRHWAAARRTTGATGATFGRAWSDPEATFATTRGGTVTGRDLLNAAEEASAASYENYAPGEGRNTLYDRIRRFAARLVDHFGWTTSTARQSRWAKGEAQVREAPKEWEYREGVGDVPYQVRRPPPVVTGENAVAGLRADAQDEIERRRSIIERASRMRDAAQARGNQADAELWSDIVEYETAQMEGMATSIESMRRANTPAWRGGVSSRRVAELEWESRPAEVRSRAERAARKRGRRMDTTGRWEVGEGGRAYYPQRYQVRTDTEEFRRWFRESKVRDAEGNPIPLYHGTVFGDQADSPEGRNVIAGIRRRIERLTGEAARVRAEIDRIKPYRAADGTLKIPRVQRSRHAELNRKLDSLTTLLQTENDKLYWRHFPRQGAEFTEFRPGPATMFGRGIYLTENPEIANHYAPTEGGPAGVFQVYARIERPYDLDTVFQRDTREYDEIVAAATELLGRPSPLGRHESARFVGEDIFYAVPGELVDQVLRRAGYDGIVHRAGSVAGDIAGPNQADLGRVWIAFDGNQVKSATANRGTFDETSPDVRYQTRLDRIQDEVLPAAERARIQAMIDRLDGLYASDNLKEAEDLDVRLEAELERYENALDEAIADTEVEYEYEGRGRSAAEEEALKTGEAADTDLEPLLAGAYAQYLREKDTNLGPKFTPSGNLADNVRASLERAAYNTRESAERMRAIRELSDEEAIAMARDAYEARAARRDRIRGKEKAGATSHIRPRRRASRGSSASPATPNIIPPGSPFKEPAYQLREQEAVVQEHSRREWSTRVFRVSVDPAVLSRIPDGETEISISTPEEAREINASDERVTDWSKIYADAEPITQWTTAHKLEKGPKHKLSNLLVIHLSKGCQRALVTSERVANRVLPAETRVEACYGGTCWVNRMFNHVWGDFIQMEVRPLQLATPEAMRGWLKRNIAKMRATQFIRFGQQGCDSHVIASGRALEWLKAAREAGLRTKSVFISAGYAPVTDAQYAALKPYRKAFELHFSLSGWFHRNEIMLRIGEMKAALDAGLPAQARIITNADLISDIVMPNEVYLYDMLEQHLGITPLSRGGKGQHLVLETPYHDEHPKHVRSRPSGEWTYICCETGMCRSCGIKCMTKVDGHGSVEAMWQVRQDAAAEIRAERKATRSAHDRDELAARARSALYQVRRPRWYSALERIVAGDKAPARAPASQWLGWLRKQPGVKAEELEWTGFEEWLEAQDGSVTREQAAEFLAQNGVQIEEVLFGPPGGQRELVKDLNSARLILLERGYDTLPAAEDEPMALVTPSGEVIEYGTAQTRSLPLIVRAAWEDLADADFSQQQDEETRRPRYASYVLPGGLNYRELLITYQRSKSSLSTEESNEWEDLNLRAGYLDDAAEERRLKLNARARSTEPYHSPHWNQTNVLVQARFNDRVDAEGRRILFIEEIQSDWHQEGREKGYLDSEKLGEIPEWMRNLDAELTEKVNTARRAYDAAQNDLDRFAEENSAGGRIQWDSATEDRYEGLRRVASQALTEAEHAERRLREHHLEMDDAARGLEAEGVPSAPWKQTDAWSSLAMKRLIRWAAEEGYDGIAWTTGAQQANRYTDATRRVVDQIKWDTYTSWIPPYVRAERQRTVWRVFEGDTNRHLMFIPFRDASTASEAIEYAMGHTLAGKGIKDGEIRVVTYKEGRKHGRSLDFDSKTGKGRGLERDATIWDIFGKKIGDQIMAKPEGGSLEGDEIVVAGQGMVQYYDGILRKVAGKLGKVGGAEVGETSIDGRRQHFLPITRELADKALEGMPLFQLRGTPIADDAGNVAIIMPQERWFERFRRGAQDRFVRAKTLKDVIERQTGHALSEEMDLPLLQELYDGRVQSRIMAFERRYVDPLIRLLNRLGVSMDDLNLYLHARHAPERNATVARRHPEFARRGIPGSGITDQQAAAIIERFERDGQIGKLRRLERLVRGMVRYKERVIREHGLENEDDSFLDSNWRHYVPLKLQYGPNTDSVEIELSGYRPPPTGRGFSTSGPESEPALGLTRGPEVNPIVAQLISDCHAKTVRAEKNEVAKALYRLATTYPNATIAGTAKPIWEVDKSQLEQLLNRRTGQVESVYKRMTDRRVHVVGVKINGEQHYITIHDAALAAAMKNLGRIQTGQVIRAVARINRYFAAINTQLSPTFVLTNLTRDLQTAGINMSASDLKALRGKMLRRVPAAIDAIYGALRGGRHFGVPGSRTQLQPLSGRGRGDNLRATLSRQYRELEQEGGTIGFFDLVDFAEQGRRLEAALRDQMGGGAIVASRKALRALGNFVEDVNRAIENAARLSAYSAAVEAGMSKKQAASLAKNLTVNFNQRGEWGEFMNSLYLFANAGVQGTARLFQALKNPAVRRVMGAFVAQSAMLALLNRYLLGGRDDDDGEYFWDKVPAWIKERNLVIMAPWDGPGSYLKFPLPYGYNIFHVLGNELEEQVVRRAAIALGWDDGKTRPASPVSSAVRLADAVMGAFNPLGDSSFSEGFTHALARQISPTVTDPLIDIGFERTFTGGPMLPRKWRESAPDSERYFSSVSATSRAATTYVNELTGGNRDRPGAVSISPEVIDYLAGTLTGGMGNFFRLSANLLVAKMQGDQVDVSRWPVLRRFLGSEPTQFVRERWWEAVDEFETLAAERRRLQSDGNDAGLSEWEGHHAPVLALEADYKALAKELTELRDQADAATPSGRAAIEELALRKTKQFVGRFRDASR